MLTSRLRRIPAHKLSPGFPMLMAVSLASADFARAASPAQAQELGAVGMQVGANETYSQVLRRLGVQYNMLIAGEVAAPIALAGKAPVGKQSLEVLLNQAMPLFKAEKREQTQRHILFLRENDPVLPATILNQGLYKHQAQLQTLVGLLSKLAPEQQNALFGPQGLPWADLPEALSNQIVRSLDGIAPGAETQLKVRIQTDMFLREANGTSHQITLATKWPGAVAAPPAEEVKAVPDIVYSSEVPAELSANTTSALLPTQNKGMFRLSELASIMSRQCSREIIVDKRCQDKWLFVASPRPGVPIRELATIMTAVPGLHWRKVKRILFLTYLPGNPQNALQAKVTREASKNARSAAGALQRMGLLPKGFMTAQELTQAYALRDLNADQQAQLLTLLDSRTPGQQPDSLQALFNDPARLAGSQLRLNVAFDFGLNNPSQHSEAHNIINFSP